MTKFLLGIDGGFSKMGWAAVLVQDGFPQLHSCGVFETKKSAKKKGVLASSDNVRRGRELWTMLEDGYQPLEAYGHFGAVHFDQARCICVEAQSWPRNASSSAKMGIAWGILIAFSELHQIPMVEASPQQIKTACTGKASASKKEVQQGIAKRVGFENLPELLDKMPRTKREHAADAVGAVIACLGSDVVRAAIR